MMCGRLALFAVPFLILGLAGSAPAQTWPTLPEKSGAIEIPTQEWPLRPGPRTVRASIDYPNGTLASVGPDTGVMLTLHNWGGTDFVGTANPKALAAKFDVVAICVNYLQSGKADSIDAPEPYDFGYLQALDALRALFVVHDGLAKWGKPFASGRTFCTGGSGGGNVTLMANKLAPRTFAVVVDLCGMKKLSDDIAFGLPGGSDLNARYSRDSKSQNFLSLDHQELRFLGNPDHLAEAKRLGTIAKVIVVHGVDDTTCPYADAEEMVHWMKRAKFDIEPHFIAKKDLDGTVFTSSGHALGNRTQIVFRIAGKYLETGGPEAISRKGKSDFEHRDEVRYKTANGAFVISYANGYPVGKFELAPKVPEYKDHTDLSYALDANAKRSPIGTVADWKVRRGHVLDNMARVMGAFPSPLRRVPLDVKVESETKVGNLIRKKVTFQSDPDDRVPAYIFLPSEKPKAKLPVILALHQTTRLGKDEPAGNGTKNMPYALELAERGYIVVVPDYPMFGEHKYDFAKATGYESGSMKAVWDNVRAIDLVETIPEADPDRIGVIGHSLGGHNALFTAMFEPRIKVIVTNCGFSSLQKDDVPSWTGPTYMPRIKTDFGSDAARVPFDFHAVLAVLAPRAVLAIAAEQDDDFDFNGVKDTITAASTIYKLYGATDRLVGTYPKTKHAFPPEARNVAYEFLDRQLKK